MPTLAPGPRSVLPAPTATVVPLARVMDGLAPPKIALSLIEIAASVGLPAATALTASALLARAAAPAQLGGGAAGHGWRGTNRRVPAPRQRPARC